ncbi:hypothetical protein E2C01_005064 [Portunus trituberculatus]|uniref:Uncharacterized protein n=1 Tax=Portunus trituberculatus TaxID=210409 RepID=A0A5B7CUK6_PORTR|nr:hypothetical protein [Portunus trituberculatus]
MPFLTSDRGQDSNLLPYTCALFLYLPLWNYNTTACDAELPPCVLCSGPLGLGDVGDGVMDRLGNVVNIASSDATHVYPSTGQEEDVVLVGKVLGLCS